MITPSTIYHPVALSAEEALYRQRVDRLALTVSDLINIIGQSQPLLQAQLYRLCEAARADESAMSLRYERGVLTGHSDRFRQLWDLSTDRGELRRQLPAAPTTAPTPALLTASLVHPFFHGTVTGQILGWADGVAPAVAQLPSITTWYEKRGKAYADPTGWHASEATPHEPPSPVLVIHYMERDTIPHVVTISAGPGGAILQHEIFLATEAAWISDSALEFVDLDVINEIIATHELFHVARRWQSRLDTLQGRIFELYADGEVERTVELGWLKVEAVINAETKQVRFVSLVDGGLIDDTLILPATRLQLYSALLADPVA